MATYQIVKYRDIVRPGSGVILGNYATREATAALKTAYPGMTTQRIWTYAQVRIENDLS